MTDKLCGDAEQKERLLEALWYVQRNRAEEVPLPVMDELAAFVKAALRSSTPDAKPVAWIWAYRDGHRSLRWRPDHDPSSQDVPEMGVTPLYEAPRSETAALRPTPPTTKLHSRSADAEWITCPATGEECHDFCDPGNGDRCAASNASFAVNDSAKPARSEQEPIAWRYRFKGASLVKPEWKYVDKAEDCNPQDSYEREPVYGHPWLRSETPAITDRMVDMLADNFWPDDWRDSDVASRIRMECMDALKEVLAPSPSGVEEGSPNGNEERKS